ncbi:GDSL-type esterase/lipase family protein [Pseudopedobacter sp.]|uniref:GDSL-type esterase/lipase family protein n=1 Tax=Pseudopedobacter sp. TaxID=1936787 RepID=UPI0033419D49
MALFKKIDTVMTYAKMKIFLSFIWLSLIAACEKGNAAKQKSTDSKETEIQVPKESIEDPIGNISTTIPVTHTRDASTYTWAVRHQEVLALNKQRPPKIVFIGNSILHYWGGEPTAPITRGADSWNQHFKPKDVRNLGFGFDRIENALWRVHHGELDGYAATHIVVLIGTNNLSVNTDDEIIEGLDFLLQSVKRHQPDAKVILMGILPRRNYESRIATLNNRTVEIATKLKLQYVNAGDLLLGTNGKINESLFSDGVHPNADGYRLLAPFINSYLL